MKISFKFRVLWILLSMLIFTINCYAKNNSYFRTQEFCTSSGVVSEVFYPTCQSLILDTEEIILWHHNKASSPEDIDTFLFLNKNNTDYNDYKIIKKAIIDWNLSTKKWKDEIVNYIKNKTNIQQIITKIPSFMKILKNPRDYNRFYKENRIYKVFQDDIYKYFNEKILDSCGAKISIDIEILDNKTVRIEGVLLVGRYYYFLDTNGILSIKGPGFPLIMPLFVSNYTKRLVMYSPYKNTYQSIDRITLDLLKIFVEKINKHKPCF